MSDHPRVTIPPGTPDTGAFQLQLGGDGVCRLVLLADDARTAVAILTLAAEDADRLAQELGERRRTYDEARGEQERGKAD